MITEDFIQAEYEKFCSGKLYFEYIFPDTFRYLYCNGHLRPTREEARSAMNAVIQYRQDIFRKWYFGKDKPFRDVLFPHIDTEADRARESRYRKILAMKVLVYNWYEKRRAEGANKLFLELKDAV